jgi:hypothetical protein
MKFRDRQALLLLVTTSALILIFFCAIWLRDKYAADNALSTTIDEISIAKLRASMHDRYVSSAFIEWPALMHTPDAALYPHYKPLLQIIQEWNPDVPDQPAKFTETLQHFNYSDPTERAIAERFRDAEVPFKVYDVPEFMHVHELWSDEYLANQFKNSNPPHVEKSKSNHFMFFVHKGSHIEGYKEPQEIVSKMTYLEYLNIATAAEKNKLSNLSEHYYFTTGSQKGDRTHSFIGRDLTLFSTSKNNFFITDVTQNKGIQCRFGMRGVIAEAHYDSGKNMIAMLKGTKRYILAPPEECKNLGIISDTKHPSFRHSVLDWSDTLQAESHGFGKVNAIDTIVRTGEVLYVPSLWFHYIISLDISIQCNSRSGFPPGMNGAEAINDCMGNVIGGKKRGQGRKERKTD